MFMPPAVRARDELRILNLNIFESDLLSVLGNNFTLALRWIYRKDFGKVSDVIYVKLVFLLCLNLQFTVVLILQWLGPTSAYITSVTQYK